MSESQRKHFNQIHKRYLSSRALTNHVRYKTTWWNYVFKELESHIDLSEPGLKCLDAMCGDAELSEYLSQFAPDATIAAFDYSDEMVKAGKKRVKGSKRIKIYRGDILKMSDTSKYDLVMIAGGLHHVPEKVSEALARIYKSLKPGGVFLNLEPTHNNPLFASIRKQLYNSNNLFEEETEKAFSLMDYNQLLAEAKFDTVLQIYPGLLGYILYYNPDAFPSLNISLPISPETFAKLDLFLGRTFVGKYLSFATWSISVKK